MSIPALIVTAFTVSFVTCFAITWGVVALVSRRRSKERLRRFDALVAPLPGHICGPDLPCSYPYTDEWLDRVRMELSVDGEVVGHMRPVGRDVDRGYPPPARLRGDQ